MNVEVSNEASEDILGLVSTVDLDLHVIVAKRSEGWDQPCEGIGVLVSSSVCAWGGGREVLSVERDG